MGRGKKGGINKALPLYCYCHSPEDDRFMICCDKCENWFHGDCAGLTRKAVGDQLQSWLCLTCAKTVVYDANKQLAKENVKLLQSLLEAERVKEKLLTELGMMRKIEIERISCETQLLRQEVKKMKSDELMAPAPATQNVFEFIHPEPAEEINLTTDGKIDAVATIEAEGASEKNCEKTKFSDKSILAPKNVNKIIPTDDPTGQVLCQNRNLGPAVPGETAFGKVKKLSGKQNFSGLLSAMTSNRPDVRKKTVFGKLSLKKGISHSQ